jgi:hypothetical protein
MAEGGIIYTKTIDPTIQDGIDNNLIIQPKYAYQKKFDFGDDWNEVVIGMFYSYTYSVTDNNKSFPIGDLTGVTIEDSGGTTSDTFTYIGLIRDAETKYLPNISGLEDDPNKSYIGVFAHKISGDIRAQYNNILYADGLNTANGYTQYLTTNSYSYTKSNGNFGEPMHPVCFTSADTTNFANFHAFKYSIQNKGTSNQSVDIYSEPYEYNITDISLSNLKTLINNVNTVSKHNVPLNNGVNAAPLPDSFFFYNGFLTIRPRIHTIAVKKIS